MRVISGTARGLKLESLDGLDTRPTLDKVKQSVFNMLFDKTYDAAVLDLFAGSGALGIEALSRYGTSCTFVDKSRKAIEIIRRNVAKARLESQATVVQSDFGEFLSRAANEHKKYDIIFLDPPYALGAYEELLRKIHEYDLLCDGGIVVLEHDIHTAVNIQNYRLVKEKEYGRVCIKFLEAL